MNQSARVNLKRWIARAREYQRATRDLKQEVGTLNALLSSTRQDLEKNIRIRRRLLDAGVTAQQPPYGETIELRYTINVKTIKQTIDPEKVIEMAIEMLMEAARKTFRRYAK